MRPMCSVQLPCDGANPCSKCVHRKMRCTYVKFHRQTAPLGPGHPARPSHDTSNSGLPPLPILQSGPNPYRLSDPPFFLGNNGPGLHPTAVSQLTASAANPLYANHQFTFPPPLQTTAPYDNALDYSARYRAQAELLSRTGVIPSDRAPPLPAIYQDTQVPHDHSTVARYAQSYNLRGDPKTIPFRHHLSGLTMAIMSTTSHQRCESSASETGSTTSRSQPSSATSSSVHLPLPPDYPQSFSRPATADGAVTDLLAGFGEGTPFFDSSITHGSGSVHHNPTWGDGPTPRANPCDAPRSTGKKGPQQQQSQGQAGNATATTPASLKELKEIWKQYMRTPLSGSGQPPAANDHPPNGSPKRERGLTRVASLPSVKTPSAGTAGWGDPMRGQNGGQPQPQNGAGVNNVQYGGQAAYSRGHNHTDDLHSYEQAILARRAPLTLHLAPRRRGNTTSTGPPATVPPSATTTTHPLLRQLRIRVLGRALRKR
ncbi:hypothetical protein BGW80DRAFT_862202 [Lactifluus volemus]|nr:hypothetical protein BGW80DRAFT_862202 [Lactifluus volemus]